MERLDQRERRLVQLGSQAHDVGAAPIARMRDQPNDEGLPALVHVLEVTAFVELARVVPGPDRAAHGADPDVAAAHVVAVLRVVRDGETTPGTRDVDPCLARLLAPGRRSLDVPV